MTLIELKPRKWGWCVFESPRVEPVFLQKAAGCDVHVRAHAREGNRQAAVVQFVLSALEREPRRMGSSCEAVNDYSTSISP